MSFSGNQHGSRKESMMATTPPFHQQNINKPNIWDVHPPFQAQNPYEQRGNYPQGHQGHFPMQQQQSPPQIRSPLPHQPQPNAARLDIQNQNVAPTQQINDFSPQNIPPWMNQVVEMITTTMRNEFHQYFAEAKQYYEGLLQEKEIRLQASEDYWQNRMLQADKKIKQLEENKVSTPGPRKFKYWPQPTKQNDTPNTNAYLDRVAELKEADEQKKSLQPHDMKCQFQEHFGDTEGDLLKAKEVVKYQAVAADMWCSKGVAKQIAEKIGKPDQPDKSADPIGRIITQDAVQENLGTVKSLISKRRSLHKFQKKPEPFITDVSRALQKMADDIIEQKYEEIAIPRMCSGLDGLNWLWVKDQLQHMLKDSNVVVHVYNLRQRASPPSILTAEATQPPSKQNDNGGGGQEPRRSDRPNKGQHSQNRNDDFQ
jgi:hypothetical protein